MKFAKLAAIGVLLALAGGVLALSSTGSQAATPGATVSPLLSCPNVDGSADNRVGVYDIISVTQAFGHDYPAADYRFLYDIRSPYNESTGAGGQLRMDDVVAVVDRYYDLCPEVDTQVAQATHWAIENIPAMENSAALAAEGYYLASTDVPGQGVHYIKFPNYDGDFQPEAPEGLVYDDGRLAAQLYVVDGSDIGWVEDYVSPQNQGGACWDGIDNGGDGSTDIADPDCGSGEPTNQALDDVNIDPLCNPSPCSWSGPEGWHLHYRLCTIHIGTPFAAAIPMGGGSDEEDCQQLQTGTANNACGEGVPLCWVFNMRVGWMGHLWNHLGNANRVPDVAGTMNGRFGDCYPDGGIWKSYNCPQ